MLFQPGKTNIVFSIGIEFFTEKTYLELHKLNVRSIEQSLDSFRVENYPPGYLMSKTTYA